MDIAQLDKNMALSRSIDAPDVVWYSPKADPFAIDGLYAPRAEGVYRRMPESVASRVSPGVEKLALCTAGGRVRFKTDSQYVALHAEMADICRMDHMAFTGIFGFDIYLRRGGEYVYLDTFRPPVNLSAGYEALCRLPGGECELMINMPLYNGVDKLAIGLQSGARVAEPGPYRYAKPVVYYGSSITQGGCASRPGNSYQAMITRALDCDHINLGFSGNAKAEPEMIDYLAGLEMSVFVCDYDHNAPSADHLAATHMKMYDTFRAAQPDTPYIMVTMPDVDKKDLLPFIMPDFSRRREIIYATYDHALKLGDKRVTFIDGRTLFAGLQRGDCTVDGSHPNDLGFYRMAQVIGAEVKRWLEVI